MRTDEMAVCPYCGGAWIEGDRYCRFCGAKNVDYKIIMPSFSTVYGPCPVKRIHKCKKCGYTWEITAMIDEEKYCPKCGGECETEEVYERSFI